MKLHPKVVSVIEFSDFLYFSMIFFSRVCIEIIIGPFQLGAVCFC